MDKLKIVIDGKECTGLPGQTILDIATENDIFIPTFCYDKRVEIYGACGICVVEVEGNPKLVKACATTIAPDMVVKTKTERVFESRKTNLELLLSNHVGDCRPPCVLNCPAGTDCQGYVGLIANGQFDESAALIKERIPLPGCIGRVCPHPCEDACRRRFVDEPISIAWLKRFAADMERENPFIPKAGPETGKKIAIIGGGPLGLSAAYYLRQKGHGITIFEAMPHFGGMLRYGIPQYRLPKEVVDAEVAQIQQMGVVLKPNMKIGKDISFDQIRKDYDAVILGVGAWISTGVGCPGEDAEGVIGGIDFLRKVVKGEPVELGETVAVVGGGNTAMDACRTAVRLGKTVYNIYRRTKDEMPADQIEIEEAEEEGVIFKNLTNPLEILKDEKGHVKEIVLQIMELGEPDASGRRSPMPVEGKTETIKVDSVILAIGQAVDSSDFPGVNLTRKKGFSYDQDTFMTSMEGVFAGGDCGNDKISIAVEAIGDAVKMTETVDAYLAGQKIRYQAPYIVQRHDIDEKTFEDRERQCRPDMGMKDAESRKDNFREIVEGYTPEQAMEEGKRCLECGCGKYHECKLYEYANEYDVKPSRIEGDINRIEFDDDHPYIMRDPAKCILCGLCVRVCSEVVGATALGLVQRGFDTTVQPALEQPLAESGCVSCGNCISVCPVGALLPKVTNRKPIPLPTERTLTTCPYCGVGCQMELKTYGNKVMGVEPAFGKANEGLLCVKGKFAYDFIDHPDRLKTPLIRKEGKLEEATWDEALDLIADNIKRIRSESGPDAIAGFASARVTNEENYIFQKFLRAAVGTNNVDHCARLCHSSTVAGLATTLGSGAMTNTIMEVLDADAILVTGSNTSESHPVVAARIGQAVRKGAKLIVIDPRKIPLAKTAEVFLQIKPGTNIAVINGMMNVIVTEGLADTNFINEKTEGYKELVSLVADYTPEKVGEICGVDPEEIRKAARIYAKAEKAPMYYAMGVTQFVSGTAAVENLSNLALICGKIGKPGSGINPLRGQNNVQGACDMGGLPGDYPAYQKVADPAMVEKFSKAWGVELNPVPGRALTEIMKDIVDDRIRCLYIMGENPMISDPDINHVEHALKHCEFLVVQDIFLTETAELAHVVLPAACYAEKDGTFTNTERRVQRVRKAVDAPEGVWADWKIIDELSKRLGYDNGFRSEEDIFEEMRKVTPSYAGITYKRLEEEGSLQWPCPTEDHPGTPILHQGKFTRGERALIIPVHFTEPVEPVDPDYPLSFTTGRILYHYHTRTMTGKSKGLNEISGKSFVEIHPKDAEKIGICDKDMVQVESRRGSVTVEAQVSDIVKEGVVFMPFHFADGPANMLTHTNALDPAAKIPEFKVSAVRVKKA